MINKKIIVLAILIVGLFALSTVSAADNLTDDVVGTDLEINEVTSSNNLETEDVIGNDDNLTEGHDVLAVSDEEDILSTNSPSYSKYSLSVYDTTISAGSSGTVTIYITPYSGSGYYAYDFYFKVYDSNSNQKISKRYYSTTRSTSLTYTISANTLSAGTYTIKLVNYADSHVMNTAKLTVKSSTYPSSLDYSVRVSDVDVAYGSEGSISLSISPSSRTSYKYYYYLKIYDSNNNEKASKLDYSTSSSYSKTYTLNAKSLNAGVYTIKIVNYLDNVVMDTAKLTVYDRNIQFVEVVGNCMVNVFFKVRISENGNYVSGQRVTFICNGKEFSSTSDSQGYASFETHLKAGTYEVTTKYGGASNKKTITVDKVYVENDYKNPRVESATGYYGGENKVSYSWQGNLKGYFQIYKGSSLIYEEEFNSNGYVSDYMAYDKHEEYYDGSKINAVGTYSAVIADEYGNELNRAKIVITKAPTHVKPDTLKTVIGARGSFYAYVYDESDSNKNIGGTAKVKINGKTYTAKVKDGVALFKNVKVPLKAKTYKYSIKFSGDNNYKSSSGIYKFKLVKTDMVLLKKNRSIKVDKYTIKLSSKQYKSLIKAFNKGKYKSIKLNTKYKHKVKVPYTKKVKKYKTTKAVKTWYATSYMPMINKMRNDGWEKVSEYTYNKANPKNKYGIGLSSYTYAVCKWVKVSYKTAYKTKYYPVKAKIYTKQAYAVPIIEIYSHGETLKVKGVAVV